MQPTNMQQASGTGPNAMQNMQGNREPMPEGAVDQTQG
jgi:hypothetical protein